MTETTDLTPTSQQSGGTSDTASAETAPGTEPGPDDTQAPAHSYRRITHADGQPGRWPWTIPPEDS